MARGWESKSVEEQMENARQKKKDAAAVHSTKPVHHSRQHENLVLARARLAKDLETTDNPRYRQFLESSLAEIDKQIALKLQANGGGVIPAPRAAVGRPQ